MNYLIENKQEYFKLLAAWKNYHREGKHKRFKVVDTRYDFTECGYHWESNLKLMHHIIYAICRNKPLEKMFKTEKCRGFYKLKDVSIYLNWIIKHLETPTKKGTWGEIYAEKYIASIGEIFGNTINVENLRNIKERLDKFINEH